MTRQPWRWPHSSPLLVLGVLVFMAAALAAGLASGGTRTATTLYLVAPVALLAGVAIGSWSSQRAHARTVATLFVTFLMLFALITVMVPGAGGGPLGYANVNAALAVQFIALSGLLVQTFSGAPRWLFRATAVLSFGLVVANASRLGVALGAIVLVAALGLPAGRRRWMWVSPSGALLAVVGAAVLTISAAADRPWTRALPFPDPTRRELWASALSQWTEHPFWGAGPGAFEQATPLAADPDTAAAHSVLLQVGAETGFVGAGALGLIVVAGLGWIVRRTSPASVPVATAAWAAFTIHAFADHVVDYVPVVFAAGLVLGFSVAPRASEEFHVGQGERPRLG